MTDVDASTLRVMGLLPERPAHLERFDRLARVMSEACAVMAPAFLGVARALGETLERFAAALPQSSAPSVDDDQWARALHHRRHRNTGPTVHADPRRNRR